MRRSLLGRPGALIALALGAAACSSSAQPVVPIEPPAEGPVGPVERVDAELPATANPFARHRVWRGRYFCVQGETDLVLRVREARGNEVVAVFEFDHPPTHVRGAYVVAGTYDPYERVLDLEPVKWLERPPDYVMVGLSGAFEGDDHEYEGHVAHDACGSFSLSAEGAP
jgi:hypothetical protein